MSPADRDALTAEALSGADAATPGSADYRAAVARVVELNHGLIVTAANRVGPRNGVTSREGCAELAQSICVAMMERFPRWDRSSKPLAQWVYAIAVEAARRERIAAHPLSGMTQAIRDELHLGRMRRAFEQEHGRAATDTEMASMWTERRGRKVDASWVRRRSTATGTPVPLDADGRSEGTCPAPLISLDESPVFVRETIAAIADAHGTVAAGMLLLTSVGEMLAGDAAEALGVTRSVGLRQLRIARMEAMTRLRDDIDAIHTESAQTSQDDLESKGGKLSQPCMSVLNDG